MKSYNEKFVHDSEKYDAFDYEPEHQWFGWKDVAVVCLLVGLLFVTAKVSSYLEEQATLEAKIAASYEDPYDISDLLAAYAYGRGTIQMHPGGGGYTYSSPGGGYIYSYSGSRGSTLVLPTPTEVYTFEQDPQDDSWVLVKSDYGHVGQVTEDCVVVFRNLTDYVWKTEDENSGCLFEDAYKLYPDMPRIIPETS